MPTPARVKRKRIKTYTFDAPASWASAFVNGDVSGLEYSNELEEFEAWNEKNDTPYVVGVSEETHFGRFNGLGTDLYTYTAYEKESMRPNRLPAPPPPRRHPVHSPSASGAREGALQRVRRLAREHQPQGERFDPEKRGTWRGSSRDLVVNGHRRGDKHGHELSGDEEGFLVVETEPDDRHPYIIVNPTDYDNWMRTQLWAFEFGAYGWTRLLVWHDADLAGALEEAAGWLADHAPGVLTTEEEMGVLFKEYQADHPEATEEEAQEGAETDMTYTESGWIPSWEWAVNDIQRGNPIYEAALLGSMEEYEAQYEEEAPKQRGR